MTKNDNIIFFEEYRFLMTLNFNYVKNNIYKGVNTLIVFEISVL